MTETRGRIDPVAPENHRECDGALSRAFQFLGKRWNGLLISVLAEETASFSELKRSLGISDSMLSDRLMELASAGLVERSVDPGPPTVVAYGLTDSGRAVLPALRSLGDWARENLTEEQCSARR